VQHLHEQNQKHFGQAHRTPFTVPPLSTALQFIGEGPGTENIPTGAWNFQGLEENVAFVLHHLKLHGEIEQDRTKAIILDKDFKIKLKAWKETTTTSLSGVNLGYNKH
jgi:hypothetical protein